MRSIAVYNPGTRVKLGEFEGEEFEFHDGRGSVWGLGRHRLLELIGVVMARQFDLQVDGVVLESCRLVRRAARYEFVYARESSAPGPVMPDPRPS